MRIKHVDLSQNRFDEIIDNIVPANIILKEASETFGVGKRTWLRNQIIKGEELLSQDKIDKILYVYNIQNEMLMGHIKLIEKCCKNKSKNDSDAYFSYGVEAFYQALYYYTNKEIQFSYFAKIVIKNALRFAEVDAPRHLLKARSKYKKLKNENNTMDEVLLNNFTPYYRKKLFGDCLINSINFDLNHVTKNENYVSDNVLKALDEVKLNKLERDVIDSWLYDSKAGWQVRVARRNGITRAAIGSEKRLLTTGNTNNILGRVIKKLRKQYQD